MRYALRPAVREDLEPMMAIGHEGIRPYVEQLFGWNASDQERGFRDGFALEHVSIVQVDGRDAGYLQLEEHPDHRFLAGLYLSAELRSKGVGTALIGELIARSRGDGRPLRLRVLQPNPAQHLYERLGFRRNAATATHIHMEFDPITIARADLSSDSSLALIRALNDELSTLYSEPGANHFHLDPEQVTGARGTGLGRRLVDTLEAEARALGVRRLVLETGVRQAAALALYRAAGFEPIPLFGEYCLSPETSVCLGKQLSSSD